MYTMDAREFNDKVMRGYFAKAYPAIAGQILTRTGVNKGRCIDLGGGPGMLGISYVQITHTFVTIYDLMPECIELAIENIAEFDLSDRMNALEGNAEDIKFPDNCIDLVMSRGSIFFWSDQEKGLKEVYRVLKPGGWAYIGGGFGSEEILAEIIETRKNDPSWEEDRKKRMEKQPPQHFEKLLEKLGYNGVVEWDNAGTWIIFQKEK